MKRETTERQYGLESTNNSKTGFAFSMPRSLTCIAKTKTCEKACYGNGVRYQTNGQKEKRQRNYRTVEFLLEKGGPELLAENLVLLVDLARPIDWIASKVTGDKTFVPWTFRIHDIGDFHSIDYVYAWLLTAEQRPECSFWFYTRSFVDEGLFESLTALAEKKNCRGWLSLDKDNYELGIKRFCQSSDNWQIAILQDEEEVMPEDMLPTISAKARPWQAVSFPRHRGGHYVQPIEAKNVNICPQILGAFPLENRANMPKPCQQCSFCLP